jgi:hypothetical protein
VSINSFEPLVADWESLLGELRVVPYDIPSIDSFRIDLEAALEKTRTFKARQVEHQTASQQATHQLAEAMAQGRYAASRMRGHLRAFLGHRNPELARFGVAPSRGSRRAPLNAKARVD